MNRRVMEMQSAGISDDEILSRMRAAEVRSQLDYLVRAWLAGGGAERRRAA